MDISNARSREVVALFPASASQPLKIALISNAPPQACGIATYAADVMASLQDHCPGLTIELFRLVDHPTGSRSDIVRRDLEDYDRAAKVINGAGFDAVWLQHEFGIFGGKDGEYVLALAKRLAAPLVVTMHTVLSEPSPNQRRIAEALGRRASRVMVMSEHGRELLAQDYGVAHDRLFVIPHGAPDRPLRDPDTAKADMQLPQGPILTTFGLIGPGKGLEHAIGALPAIARANPGVLYRIIGETHPVLKDRHGEAYRNSLIALVEELGVSAHVEWVDRFVEIDELLDNLAACDIYITPYPGLQQATSGTLSYAVALGKAVVSTPYVHARELLAGGVGTLVEPNSPKAIADAVCALLADRPRLKKMQERAYAAGRSTIWSAFAENAADLLRGCVGQVSRAASPARLAVEPVLAMSDDVGMLQHARFDVPDRSHGYSIDDNARALLLAGKMAALGDTRLASRAMTYAAFLQDAWNPEARSFRNFLGYDRKWLEDAGSEDANARAFWALGETIHSPADPALRNWAVALYDESLPHIAALGSPRSLAFATLGAAARLRHEPDHAASRDMVQQSCETLLALLAKSRRPDWAWFESLLAYDNARLSEALLVGGEALGQSSWIELGLDSLSWVAQQQTGAKGQFRPIGTEGFGRQREIFPFDQQPLEALAHIEACLAAARISHDPAWQAQAMRAWRWFLGDNDRAIALVDSTTLRCYDGLTPVGRNQNSGAESILAFCLSQVAIRSAALKGGPTRERNTIAPPLSATDGQARTPLHEA